MIKIKPALAEFVRPSEHSRFSPSAGDRWIACPASIKLSEGIPNQTSTYAIQGTEAHQVCEDMAYNYFFEREKTSDLMCATPENLHSANGYCEVISKWLADKENIGELLYFGLEGALPVYPSDGCFGTADTVIIGTKGCAVIDFKNGVGHIVGARSSQLQIYLLGVFLNMENAPEDYKYNSVIFQPRVTDTPKEYTYSTQEMREFNIIIVEKIAEAERAGIKPVLGNHCHWCPARQTNDPAKKCPAQKQKQVALAAETFNEFLHDSSTVPLNQLEINKRDKALVKIITLAPLLTKVAKEALEEFNYRMIENKEVIDGLRVSEKEGRAKWIHEKDEEMVAELNIRHVGTFYEDVPAHQKVKTITQVKKIVGENNFDSSLTKKEIKKTVVVAEFSANEILGELAQYSAGTINNTGEMI